jgi:hypothetical protein
MGVGSMSRGSRRLPRADRLGLAALFLGACSGSGLSGKPKRAPDPPPPQIAVFAFDCDIDAGIWTLTAEATAWTGGGVAVLTRDLQYVEEHAVTATASAPDGTREDLELVLGIVSDWRAQAAGRSTVFTCAQEPTLGFTLLGIDGEAADCRLVGPLAAQVAELPDVACVPDE